MARNLWFVIQREERDDPVPENGYGSYSEAVTACREIRNQGGFDTQYPKILVLDQKTYQPVPDRNMDNAEELPQNLEIPFWAQFRFRERDFDVYRNK